MTFIPDDNLQENLNRYVPPEIGAQDIPFGEKLAASFKIENSIGAMLTRNPNLPDYFTEDDFNPFDHLTDEEALDSRFLDNASLADSMEQLEAVRSQTSFERRQREKITGADGFAAALIAGIADPINLIPVGGVAYKTYQTGGSILKSALATGAVAAGSASLSETTLQANQLERTGEETLLNIGGAFLLGSALGSGSAALSRAVSDHPNVVREIEQTMNVSDRSAGAADVMGDVSVKGDAVQEVYRKLSPIDPMARGLTAKSSAARRVTARLSESPLELESNAPFQAVESIAKTRRDMLLSAGQIEHLNIYKEMKKSGAKMPRREFNELVSREMRNPGSVDNPYISRSAESWRSRVYDPISNDMVEVRLLDPDADVTTAQKYVNRRWSKEKVGNDLPEFIRVVSDWLETRQDFEVRADAEEVATEIAGRIMGTPDGMLPYDEFSSSVTRGGKPNNLKGVFKSRVFEIPDEMVESFLENDIEKLATSFLRQATPDIELVRAFGGNKVDPSDAVNMTAEIKSVQDDYTRMMSKADSDKARRAIAKERDAVITALSGMRDRIRGVYDIPDKITLGRRLNSAARNLNYTRMMGGVVASSIPDISRTFMAEGFMRAFGSGWRPLVENLSNLKPIKAEIQHYGIAIDAYTSGRIEAIADISDYALGGTKVEKALEYMASHFGNISLMNQWTDMQKTIHALAMQSRVYDDLAKGVYDNRLARLGIDEADAQGILEQAKKYGRTDSGARLFNAKLWDRQDLALKWATAIRKESDRVIIMPGQEKPLFMSRDAGKTLLQFRSFMISSTQRTLLASLQGQDANAVGGMLSMISLGAMAYAFKQWDADREISDDPMVWIVEGIDRSGATGMIMEANNTIEKITGQSVGLRPLMGVTAPASRFASRSVAEGFLGPTYGSLTSGVLRVANAATDESDWTESDTRALRRLLPYQNLTFLRRGIDKLEESAHEAID